MKLHELEPDEDTQRQICSDLGLSDDWIYKDVPRTTKECWEGLLNTIGKGDYYLLTEAKYPHKTEGFTYRGQMMISPKGIENLRKSLTC